MAKRLDCILDRRTEDQGVSYLVLWEDGQHSWQNFSSLLDNISEVMEFQTRRKNDSQGRVKALRLIGQEGSELKFVVTTESGRKYMQTNSELKQKHPCALLDYYQHFIEPA